MSTPVRVGINGFGRMGRLVVRALRHQPALQLTHINEHKGGLDTAAHLLQFDTVHGRYDGTVATEGSGHLVVDGHAVSFSEHSNPNDIPWADLGVDVVIEATGKFKTAEALEPHLANGAHRAVVACPVKSPGVLNVVMGCNDHLYDPA
ncbi:MAG TPA: type I glyceraldehyde-3-phosphate dehydrogenase, partial [Acidimicrobiaceae bacterium]|nr:type I glyceraldehyde-3-phosphate dehydrogenase [Acidimicrobiaceae bacterium]